MDYGDKLTEIIASLDWRRLVGGAAALVLLLPCALAVLLAVAFELSARAMMAVVEWVRWGEWRNPIRELDTWRFL